MPVISDLRRAVWHFRQGGLDQLNEWRRRSKIERRINRGGVSPEATTNQQDGKDGHVTFAPHRVPDRAPRRSDLTVGVHP